MGWDILHTCSGEKLSHMGLGLTASKSESCPRRIIGWRLSWLWRAGPLPSSLVVVTTDWDLGSSVESPLFWETKCGQTQGHTPTLHATDIHRELGAKPLRRSASESNFLRGKAAHPLWSQLSIQAYKIKDKKIKEKPNLSALLFHPASFLQNLLSLWCTVSVIIAGC